jgi:hypothetical protein
MSTPAEVVVKAAESLSEGSATRSFTQSFTKFGQKVQDWIPRGTGVWIILFTCVVLIIGLSRVVSLQKSVAELQSRPIVDEHVVRQVVRGHLEETVRAMEQHNKMQMQMRQQQAMEQARLAAAQAQAATAAQVVPEKQPAADAAATPPDAAVPAAVVEVVAENSVIEVSKDEQPTLVKDDDATTKDESATPKNKKSSRKSKDGALDV